MDKDTAKQIGIAVVGSLLISAVLYLFTSISDLKHNQDTENSTAKSERTQVMGEVGDLWGKHNAKIEQDGEALMMFFEFQLEVKDRQSALELKQEQDNSARKDDLNEFKVEYYKNELAKANK